jgi:hypothetical protein
MRAKSDELFVADRTTFEDQLFGIFRAARSRCAQERGGGAKPVFHCAGLGDEIDLCRQPWLRFIRQRFGSRVHFWPFDGASWRLR